MFKFSHLYGRVYAIGVVTLDFTEHQEILDWMGEYTDIQLNPELQTESLKKQWNGKPCIRK